LEASGKETRGAGTASATVRASLAPDASGSSTEVTMNTTMNVTGRPAQFGRGVMVEVGGKLVEQFATNLAQLLAGGSEPPDAAGSAEAPVSAPAGDAGVSVDGAAAPAAATDTPSGNGSASAATNTTTAAPPIASTSAPAQEDSLNLLKVVGPVLLKRLVPVAVGAAGLALLSRFFWRLRRRGQAEKA
jgi:uncharacterized protein